MGAGKVRPPLKPGAAASVRPGVASPDASKVSAGSPAAGQYLDESDTAQLEQEMLGLINRDRLNPANEAETQGRAPSLQWNGELAAVARAHSEDMLRRGFFAHINPEGESPAERVTAAGIPWQAEGENIAIYRGVAGAQAAFMNEPRFEPNHRANILSPRYTEVGVGIVRGPDGMYYITQEFIEIPAERGAAEAASLN